MAVLDTHKAFEHLTAAGYSKEMAKALLDTLGESGENLATKADIRELAQGGECLRQHVDRLVSKADLCELVQMIKADLREFELRMTLKAGAMIAVFAAFAVELELLSR
jgi:hypothetical protein